MMKQRFILSFTVILLIPALLISCSSQKNDVVDCIDRYMAGIADYDSDVFENEIFFNDESERQLYFWGLSDEEFELYTELSDFTSKFTVYLQYAASLMTYNIENVTLNSDSAKATLSVSYTDGSNIACTAFERMYSSVMGSKLDGLDYNVSELLYSAIYDLTFNTEPDYITNEIILELKQTDNGWKIIPNDDMKIISTSAFYTNADEIGEEINKYTKQSEVSDQ